MCDIGVDNADIAMVAKREIHPAHAGFAEAVDADRIDLEPVGPQGSMFEDIFTGFALRHAGEYDIYIFEDAGDLYGAPLLAYQSDPTFILLATSHRVTLDGYNIRPKKLVTESVRWVDRMIDITCLRHLANRYVHGIIANSQISAEAVRQLVPKAPLRIAEPYVQPSVYRRLRSVQPQLNGRGAVFIGEAREHKGIDLLVDAWPAVRSHIPDARLEIIGRGHDKKHEQVEGVTVRGYIDSIDEALERASLYVHPARYETWGVAPMEAMLAGVPPIVTTQTGVAKHVTTLDQRLVVPPTADDLASAISWYFKQNTEMKHTLSARAREIANSYDEQTQTEAFSRKFQSLLSEIR